MKKIIYTIIALTISDWALAQSDSAKNTKQLDQVVVTAAKMDLKQSETGKIVTVLNQQFIRNNAGKTLSEMLNTQAGVFFNGANNTPGTNIDAYFRGADGGNLLIVVDGIPVYDPSQPNNAFDLNSIPLEQIERIEILKGGQSTLWGSDAVAGVIQIFLKKETKKPIVANGALSYGSYNTLRAGAGLNGTINRLGYSLQYNYTTSDGISAAYDSTGKGNFDNDGFRQNSLQVELHYTINEHLNVKAFGNFGTYYNDLDEGPFVDDKDYTAKNSNNVGALHFIYHKKNFSWNALISYQQAKRTFEDDSTDISSPYSKFSYGKYMGNTITAETFGNAQLVTHLHLVGGLQYIHQNTDQYYIDISDYGNYISSIGKDSARINQFSAYASLLLTDLHGFNFEAGGRINNHSIYGNNATYTFNPSYNIGKQSKIFFNLSTGYKIPSLYQLYSEYGNKGLKPESSTTYELGLQTELLHNMIFLRVAGFVRNTKDLIIFYMDSVTYASQYVNGDKQNDYGFEIESNIRLGNSVSWGNNVSYVDGQCEEDKMKTYNLYRRPKFTANSILTLTPTKNFTIAPSLRFVGSRMKGPYDPGPDIMPAYYTIDCFVSYSINKVRLFGEFHNITNQQYFDIPGYNCKRFNMMAGINFNL
ncbi:MAG TPA: TonB-dependent receptor [Puia sp.]|nr:TonB-dependent receptor [Puia sp.]